METIIHLINTLWPFLGPVALALAFAAVSKTILDLFHDFQKDIMSHESGVVSPESEG